MVASEPNKRRFSCQSVQPLFKNIQQPYMSEAIAEVEAEKTERALLNP